MNIDKAVSYHYDQFPPAGVKLEDFVLELLDATDALARYDQMLKNMHNSEILLAPLRNQEAVISSRMEGTISTMDEILRYEADSNEHEADAKNTRQDVVETILYQRALNNAQKAMNDGYPMSQHLVKTIHQQLLSFGRGASKSPGQYKTEQNYLADKIRQEVLFVPISPEKLEEGMEKLFNYIEEDGAPTLLKTALMHLEFEALHPFLDGNGRIGRMLITLFLWKSNMISAPHFYISAYFEKHKDAYIDLMRNVSQNNDWGPWCKFFLQAIAHQAKANLQIAENIRNLYEEMKQVFSDVLASKWSVATLDFIFTNPIFRNNKFTSQSGIPGPTASRFTRILLEKELIRTQEEAAGRRPALYSFEPLLRLVRV